MKCPRPSMGRVNRYYDSNGPGSFGYGRSGTHNEGQNHRNSNIKARVRDLGCRVYEFLFKVWG